MKNDPKARYGNASTTGVGTGGTFTYEDLDRVARDMEKYKTRVPWGGVDVVVTPDTPRMQLSARVCEVLSPECIRETNAWMLGFFGVVNILADNDMVQANGKIYMNPRTYQQFRAMANEVVDKTFDYRR